MKKILITAGSFIGTIAGIVVIKMLDLPALVTIILVAGLLIGMIVVAASQMGGKAEDKATPAEGQSTPERT